MLVDGSRRASIFFLSPLMASTIMNTRRSNIVLIGMPGSGKSTVGVILAKALRKNFIDTDVVIQDREQRSLQDIVDRDGYLALREIEERVILGLECEGHVIATGGSVVYSNPAMEHLRAKGIIVFLNVDLATLKSRVRDYETRGLAKRPDQGIDDLFAERFALYRHYDDITIDCSRIGHEEVCRQIAEAVREKCEKARR
jgi:shikimate kinase